MGEGALKTPSPNSEKTMECPKCKKQTDSLHYDPYVCSACYEKIKFLQNVHFTGYPEWLSLSYRFTGGLVVRLCGVFAKIKTRLHPYSSRVETDKQTGVFYCDEKVTMPSGRQVSRARIDELNRRVVLNYNPNDGTYDVGRLGENGKIQEKAPDYRP